MKTQTILRWLVAAILAAPLAAHAVGERSVSGTITVQNTSSSDACTSASCVDMDITDRGTVSVQVSGTYTGALSVQRTNDGITWQTLSASTTLTNAAGTQTATVASGTTGTFAVSNVTGFRKIRITALAAVTGTATVVIYTAAPGGGGGGSSGGGGGAVTSTDGALASIGTTTDAAAGTNTAGTVISQLRELTKASTQLPAAVGPQTPANSLATFNSASTGAQSSVASSATDVTCLASNAARKGATLYNDSTAVAYVLLTSGTSSATAHSVQMTAGAYYEVPFSYTGAIKCIWASATGSMRVTELTN